MSKPKTTKITVAIYVEVEMRDSFIKSILTEKWQKHFYMLHTPADLAEHLAFNLVKGGDVSSLDGFADQDDKHVNVKIDSVEAQ